MPDGYLSKINGKGVLSLNVFSKYFQLREFPIKLIFRIQGQSFVIIYVTFEQFLSQTRKLNDNSFKRFDHLLCSSSGDMGMHKTGFLP